MASTLADSLHRLERTLLPHLSEKKKDTIELASLSGLDETEVRRALQWLANKQLASLSEQETEIIELGSNGRKYVEVGHRLPERKVFSVLEAGARTIADLQAQSKLSREELSVSLGVLRKKNLLVFSREKPPQVSLNDKEKEKYSGGRTFPEEDFLATLQQGPRERSSLTSAEQQIADQLQKRKNIVSLASRKTIAAMKTRRAAGIDTQAARNSIETLTPSMLRDGSWKNRPFRRYDLKSTVPKSYAAKKQPYRRFLDEVRQKFVGMGFQELSGPIVETEFWDMDALYMPQFHSARDIHDAYYVRKPAYAQQLPNQVVTNVKKAHEQGIAGSKGWRYSFDIKRTHRHILRTQDTAISPRMLASPKLRIPGKYFQIVRCFRYDVIDATHLADFNQTGGFVIEEGVNLRHLFGLLRLFAEEFCETEHIKVTPAYFPFTEPSASLYAKHPEMGWIELAGSGIFRPEMCTPLGVTTPVIAWGVGLERLAMFRLGMKDIRQLFSHDLQFLRNARVTSCQP